jgi:hypothetical protein
VAPLAEHDGNGGCLEVSRGDEASDGEDFVARGPYAFGHDELGAAVVAAALTPATARSASSVVSMRGLTASGPTPADLKSEHVEGSENALLTYAGRAVRGCRYMQLQPLSL